MRVDASYNNTALIKIDFAAENDIANRHIGEENKSKFPYFNFVSNEKIHDQLKSLSSINRPFSLTFFACHIDKNTVDLLNLIPEIQSLVFLYCSFDQCTLKNINTSKYFFSLMLTKCTSSHGWKEILHGIKNFHKLSIGQSSIQNDDWQSFFSTQTNINEVEILFTDIPENIFHKVTFSSNLKMVNIINSSISEKDVYVLINSLDKKTILKLSNITKKTNPLVNE
ncbi:MAG: hypothetical protein LBC68_04385 [Prevotellaceae bacterium]|jgi:hypothetical protein|nr:hypothetical protein [Prevotellaceae bacterium]